VLEPDEEIGSDQAFLGPLVGRVMQCVTQAAGQSVGDVWWPWSRATANSTVVPRALAPSGIGFEQDQGQGGGDHPDPSPQVIGTVPHSPGPSRTTISEFL